MDDNKILLEITGPLGKFVIREWNDITPYVVHQTNDNNDYWDGDYCRKYKDALEIIKERAGLTGEE